MTALLPQKLSRFSILWIVQVIVAIGYEARKIVVRTLAGEFPLHACLAFVVIKAFAVAGYAVGKQRDSWMDAQGNAVVRTQKGTFVVDKEEEMTREKRMGVLGLPLGHASHDHCDLLGEKAAVPVAVVVPGLLSGKADQLHDAAEERLQLHALLRCIHGQTEMPSLVILVDDGSPTFPSVAHLRQEMHGSCSCSIRLLTVKNAVNLGPAAARNKGIDTAVSLLLPHSTSSSGLLIFLTDLDCIPTSTWIEEGQQHWLRSRRSTAEAMLLGGFTLAARPPSIFGHFHDAFGTLNPRILAGKPLYAPSCNMAIYLPREDAQQEQLCKFPRFDESFKEASMEDVLFCLESSARRGVEFQLAPRMVVEHVYTSSTATRWATWEGPDVFGALAGWNLFLCFCSGLCAIFRQFRKYGRWERACDVRYPAYAGHHLTKSLELPSPVTPLVNL